MRLLILVLGLSVWAVAASAQNENSAEDTIVVTGSLIPEEPVPGITLKRSGDFLLLPVTVTNDSREEKQRRDEIYKTLLKMLEKARRDGLEVSVLVNDSFVRPLTRANHEIDLSKDGNRPDTSRATIHVSTRLTAKSNPGMLIDKVKSFVSGIAVVGRTVLEAQDEVEISIRDPNQYRDKIIKLVAQDIKNVTSALGPDYRIQLVGIDRRVKWVRSGLAEVTLYIPYSYEVLPAANAYFLNNIKME